MIAKSFKTQWHYANETWETNEVLIVEEKGVVYRNGDTEWHSDLVMTPFDKDGNKLPFANEDEGNEWMNRIKGNFKIIGNRDGYEIHEC